MKIFSIIIIGMLTVLAFSSVPEKAAAQDFSSLGMSAAPQIFELDVFPGEILNEKITVGNLSEAALPVAVKSVDFTAEGDSGEMVFDESSQDASFASRFWFKIENRNFILEPGGKRDVMFSINIPQNAEPGGHYATMLFEPQLPSFYFKQGQPRAIPVIGVLFLISVKNLSLEPQSGKKLEVVEFSIPKADRMSSLENAASKLLGSMADAAEVTITKKTPSSFSIKIKNNDIYHLKPSGKVLIYDIFNRKVGETEVPQKTILPGKVRNFPVDFSPEVPEKLKWLPASVSNFLVQNLFFGKYRAELELEVKGPGVAELSEIGGSAVFTFFSFSWKFWPPFALMLALIVLFIVKYRNRAWLALKVLIKK